MISVFCWLFLWTEIPIDAMGSLLFLSGENNYITASLLFGSMVYKAILDDGCHGLKQI